MVIKSDFAVSYFLSLIIKLWKLLQASNKIYAEAYIHMGICLLGNMAILYSNGFFLASRSVR